MILVATFKSNGSFFRAQSIRDDVDKLKATMQNDTNEKLRFEVLHMEDFEDRTY